MLLPPGWDASPSQGDLPPAVCRHSEDPICIPRQRETIDNVEQVFLFNWKHNNAGTNLAFRTTNPQGPVVQSLIKLIPD